MECGETPALLLETVGLAFLDSWAWDLFSAFITRDLSEEEIRKLPPAGIYPEWCDCILEASDQQTLQYF